MSDEVRTRDQAGWDALVSGLRRPAVLLSALAVVTFILYSGTLLFQFVWDDKTQIVDNPIIRSLSNLHRVFISDLWYHAGSFQLYYRPLFIVWSMLNYAAVGLRPWGWHLGAVLMHIATVLAVFWLVRKLGLEYWTAALAALIFALHPIHIECVAWISAVSDSMVTMLAALSFVAFLNAREVNGKHEAGWKALALALFASALLTKEIVLTFPLLIGLYEWLYPTGKSVAPAQRLCSALSAALPYVALTVGYLFLRKFTLHQVTGTVDRTHTFADMLFSLPYVVVFYLRQLVLPIGLTGLYYTPYATSKSLEHLLPSVLLLAAIAGLICYWARKKSDKVVMLAGIWMVICLAPALYLRGFADGDFVRDRYIYLGSVGFAILLAKLIQSLPGLNATSARTVQITAAVALCGAYIVASVPQQAYWASDLLVYSRGHQLYPENPVAAVALAREYTQIGASERAIPLVEEVHRTHPQYVYGAYALAYVYIGAGRKAQGRAALLYAEQVMPAYVNSETGGASVAAMWGQLGDYDRALQLCSRILAQDPNLYSALYNCGAMQLMAGHYGAAEQLLRRAIQTAPELAASRHFLGRALFLESNYSEAQLYLAQAVAMDPTVYDNHYWLGRVLEQSGNKQGARREYGLALQLNRDSDEAKLHLAALEGK